MISGISNLLGIGVFVFGVTIGWIYVGPLVDFTRKSKNVLKGFFSLFGKNKGE